VTRLRRSLRRRRAEDALVLVGRRDLRSNNSWMHNLGVLVKGKERCTIHVHPTDASRLGLDEGGRARVSSAAGAVDVPVEVTAAVMPGVVSIPHGWGHGGAGTMLGVASRHEGVNVNVLTDARLVDPLSGNAVLNGIPVRVEALGAALDLGAAERAGRATPATPVPTGEPDPELDAGGRPAATTAAEGLQGL
jgi:anaerobic selenocysteine-containing dehydrogenase